MTNKEKNSHQEPLFLAFETNTHKDTWIFNMRSCMRKFSDTTSCPIPCCYSNNLKKSYCYNNPTSVRTTGLLLSRVYYTTKDTSKCIIVTFKWKGSWQNEISKVTKIMFKFKKKWAHRQNKSSALSKRIQLLVLAGVLKDCFTMKLFPVLDWRFKATLCLYRQLNCRVNRGGYWKPVCAGVWFPCDEVKQWPSVIKPSKMSSVPANH